MFKIKQINLQHILENENSFNTNHHFTSEDYEKEIEKTELKNYIHILGREYTFIDLSCDDCNIILKACASGVITLNPPKMYQEDLDTIAKKINLPFDTCFVRLERCSLKDSCYGTGHYITSIDIINALCTSYRCYNYIKKCLMKQTPIRLYIMPWVPNVREENEFRVFVCNQTITGISQYNIYKASLFIQLDWVKILYKLNHLVSHISKNTTLTSYTMDICQVDDEILLLELNSFGANMAAGSCLFNWIDDHDQLYGNTDYVEIRLVSYNQE